MEIVILVSGRGSNFQAIAEAISSGSLKNTKIKKMISSSSTAPALEIAERFGIVSEIIEKPDALLNRLTELNPDYIVLAGYMKILKPDVIKKFENRILNIHPSLLPAFKGLNAQKQAFDAGVKESGCTVHWVTEGVDEGPILNQMKVEILKSDTLESFSQRLLKVEHVCLVETLKKLEKTS